MMADPTSVLRPEPSRLKRLLSSWIMGLLPFVFRILRKWWPIPRFANMAVVTRYDDVREVFLDDAAFGVPYREKSTLSWAGSPSSLGWATHLNINATRLRCGWSSGATTSPIVLPPL